MKYWDKALTLTSGCTKVSEACQNCWAETNHNRFLRQHARFDHDFAEMRIHPENLDIPLKTRKPQVFAVWNDLFHEGVRHAFIVNALVNMNIASRHTYLVLTKRPELMRLFFEENRGIIADPNDLISHNIYFGTTVENQRTAEERIPHLLKVPGKKFLSVEPLLEPLEILYPGPQEYCCNGTDCCCMGQPIDPPLIHGIDWVVVGAESGSKRRECKVEWIESVVEQCRLAGIRVFVKQIHLNGKLVKDIDKFPEHLRIRELPWIT